MNLDSGAQIDLDESRIPESLASLVPFVRRWGFSRNADQDLFVSLMVAERPDEVEKFRRICDALHGTFHSWISSLPSKHLDDMTEEDWSHPQWAFVSTYKVRELLPLSDDEKHDPALQESLERTRVEARHFRFEDARIDAREDFRSGNYAGFVSRMEPYEDLLTPTESKKLALARRRQNEPG